MEENEKKELALQIIDRLKKAYPDADCTLDYDDAWKLLVSVRLAAQCTDARVNVVVEGLYKKYPDSLKLVHLLPAVFTLGVALLLLGTPFCLFSFTPIILYALLVCIDSTIQNKSLSIGVYSIAAAFIQLIGYGTGFWRAWWQRCIRGKDEFEAFQKNFYK